PAVHGTSTGLSDLRFGFKARIKGGATAVALEALWQTPLGYARDEIPSLGRGVQQGLGLLHVGAPIAKMGFVQVSGGYRYLSEDLNPRIEGGADAGLWLGSSVMLAGHYDLAME